ncbi:hypothetical protein ACJRO7_002794 [Eucalyptus globulus]|uniref:Uncharacterized protein n=1 Tax=Eucalyptus globulus TaxID=34317 RepID=A0ABD3LWM5_EUCGL
MALGRRQVSLLSPHAVTAHGIGGSTDSDGSSRHSQSYSARLGSAPGKFAPLMHGRSRQHPKGVRTGSNIHFTSSPAANTNNSIMLVTGWIGRTGRKHQNRIPVKNLLYLATCQSNRGIWGSIDPTLGGPEPAPLGLSVTNNSERHEAFGLHLHSQLISRDFLIHDLSITKEIKLAG